MAEEESNNKNRLITIIIASVVVIAGIIGAIFLLKNGSSEGVNIPEENDSTYVVHINVTDDEAEENLNAESYYMVIHADPENDKVVGNEVYYHFNSKTEAVAALTKAKLEMGGESDEDIESITQKGEYVIVVFSKSYIEREFSGTSATDLKDVFDYIKAISDMSDNAINSSDSDVSDTDGTDAVDTIDAVDDANKYGEDE